MHWAAERGHTEMAQLLLQNGAHINAENTNGVTALFLALRDYEELAHMLREKGAQFYEKELLQRHFNLGRLRKFCT